MPAAPAPETPALPLPATPAETPASKQEARYTVRYVLALCFIALLAVYSFAEMRTHIVNGANLSSHVDDAIYQYAIANRIVTGTTLVLSAHTADERNEALKVLHRSYEEFVVYSMTVQDVVNQLREMVEHENRLSPLDAMAHWMEKYDDDVEPSPTAIEALYYEAPYQLDTRFREIISLTELFLSSNSKVEQQEAAHEIAKLVQNDVSEGSRLVGLGLQETTTYHFEIAALILSIYTAVALITLMFIGAFMFRPLFHRVVATEEALRHKINEQDAMLHLVEQTETRLRIALEGMQDGLWDWDLRTNEVYYSDRWLMMLGYQRDELPATLEAWQRVVYPADRQFAYQELEHHFADPEYPYQITLRYLHKDGGVRFILARGKALRDAEGKPYRMMGGHTDVTELTQTQEILREQKLILELFTQNAPVAVAMLDRQLRFLNVSTRWLNDYQLTTSDVMNQSFFAVHTCFPVRWISALREALSGIPSDAEEDSFEKPDANGKPGETVFVRWRIQPWRDAQGFIGGVILFSEMITEEIMLRRDVARASGLNQALAEFVSTELLYTGTAIEPSLEEICRFASQSLQVSRVGVWRIDDDGSFATSLRLFNVKEGAFQSGGRLDRADCFNFFARLSMNRPAIFEDAETSDLISAQMLKYLAAVDVRSAICIPIRVEQKIWGFMTLAAGNQRHWQNYEVFFAQRLADVVAISLTAHQRQQLNTSLVKAREAAEAATVTKSRFVANMSHEVRTPLNGIIGVAEILSRTDLSAKQGELVGVLQNSCQHLLSIVTDILDFSKLEAGGVHLESIPFDLAQMLRELTDLLRPKAGGSKVEIVVRYQPRLPQAFIGDPTRIRQVLMNLLSNAVKFTQAGHITIGVHGHDKGDGNWQLQLSVTDSGIGVPANKMDGLFDKFTQADSSTTRKYGGTGLGLTITKELVELMNGTIQVSSREGHGATFTVNLMLQADKNMPHKLPPAQLRGLNVLVLDDSPDAGNALQEQIGGLGAKSAVYALPSAAIAAAHQALLEKEGFDVALIDVDDEGTNAFALVDALKTDEKLRSISVVAMRASDRLPEETLLTKGFVTTLRKPVLPTDLLHVLQGVVQARKTGNMTTLFASGHTAAKVKTAASGALKGARILLAEDNDTNQLIVSHFLSELGCTATVASNGAEAVDAFTRDPDFAVILMDCQMPDMDGFAATAAIRALPQGAKVPIVALTANTQGSDRDACLAAGMSEYIAKPVRLDVLRQKLSAILEGPQPGASAQPPAPTTTPQPALPDEPIVMRDLHTAFGDDAAVVKRIISSFLANASNLLAEADAALQASDMVKLGRTAHTLKGAALSVYANPLADDAKKLETNAANGAELECRYMLNLLRRHVDQIEKLTNA